MKTSLAVTLAVALAMGLGTREGALGTGTFWWTIGVPYALLSAWALYRFYDDGTLLDLMRFRSGDLTIGILLGGGVFGAAWAGHHLLFGSFSPKLAWLYRLGLLMDVAHATPRLFFGVAVIAALEEIVWRGLVMSSLSQSLGQRRAWPLSAVLYAAAHVPTIFTLSDPEAGRNPLVVLAALGCGLVWAFAMSLIGRLPPLIVSHAVFTYFAATVLLPRFG